jgi:equilibrative nucleoside transporter 1/2/3
MFEMGKLHLGSWYAVVSIAMFNVGDLVGRYITLIDSVKLENRPG